MSAHSLYNRLLQSGPSDFRDASFMLNYELREGVPGDASDIVREGPRGMDVPLPDDSAVGQMSVFRGARGPLAFDVDVEWIADSVRYSEGLRRAIFDLRYAMRVGVECVYSPIDRVFDCDCMTCRKNRLPAVTVSGCFHERHRIEDFASHSGLVVVDIDELDDAESVRERVRQIPQAMCGFVSPRANGVKVISAVDPMPKSADEHSAAVRYVAAAFQLLLRAKVDGTGYDLPRLCYMSYDPDAVYNPSAPRIAWRPSPMPEVAHDAEDFGPVNGDDLESAVMSITTPSRSGKSPWASEYFFKVGSALKADAGIEGRAIFERWAAKGGPMSERMDDYWNRLPTSKGNLGVIFNLAKQHGWFRGQEAYR